MATITSLGAAQEVTGSCHLLEVNGQRVLLDCGMHQGGDTVTRMRKEHFDFDPKQIDAVILSHAHLDHSGLLPLLVHKGYSGPIYCTGPSRNLLAVMLDDSAGIYLRDLEHQNLRLKRSGRKTMKPVYTEDDVLHALQQCVPVDYRQDVLLAGDLTLKFLEAGHILGSAVVELRWQSLGKERVLVFSGDLGNETGVLMRDPDVPERADVVLMESTYGDRDHRPFEHTLEEFQAIIEEARDDNGVILMPAFSVGRTQELLYHLGCFYHQGKLDGWQVFLDSPMAIEVTRLYDQWLETLDPSDLRAMRHNSARTLEEFLPTLSLTPSVEESIQLNRLHGGAIIIAGSGMCNGGRIRHHLKHRLWHKSTHVVFAGFQARGTLGRKMVDGDTHVRFFGQRFVVNAKVHTLGGFSAHAGRSQLLAWARAIGGEPRFRLVHGETSALVALAHGLREQGHDVTIAEPGEPYGINGQ
ncbi:MAG: MBL fold metallo-hydrolase [Alcanivoracaceae bacterium]|jgi:metallo-beta-lactamase family protein|nr:MBL fold metallo-hydrolase [Alcanivoracaceae bacterium]